MAITNAQIFKELQDLKLILTGNGKPEHGVVFRMAMLEKEIVEIKEDVDRVSQHPYIPGKKEKKSKTDGEVKTRWLDPKTKQLIASYLWKLALIAVLGKEAIGL